MMFFIAGIKKVLWKQMHVVDTGLGDWKYLALSLHIGEPRTLVTFSELHDRKYR